MRIIQTVILRGPNRYLLTPVLEALLDTMQAEPQAEVVAKRVANLAIIYQQQVGSAVSWRTVIHTDTPGVYRLAVAYRNSELAQAALALSCRTVAGLEGDDRAAVARLREIELDRPDSAAPLDSNKQIIAVTGTNGKTTTVRLIAHIMVSCGRVVGWTSTNGSWLDNELIATGDNSGPISARAILERTDVEVAVLETARGGILREGLAYTHCDVAKGARAAADVCRW